jgi:hypothetical protein
MRPQQQNRRMRGRNNNNNGGNNNNNRKGPNPLTRNYESNGPDVKIRGSAQQIADKYAQLARDSQSSGDRVMAENYLQHAEHYNRIIAAAQAQMPIQQMQNNRDDSDEDMDDDRDDFENQGNVGQGNVSQSNSERGERGNSERSQPVVVNHGAGPQPIIEGTPAEVALNPEAAGNGNDSVASDSVNDASGVTAANGTEEEVAAPRRPRRPRRPRTERTAEAAPAEGDVPQAAEVVSAAKAVKADTPEPANDTGMATVEN